MVHRGYGACAAQLKETCCLCSAEYVVVIALDVLSIVSCDGNVDVRLGTSKHLLALPTGYGQARPGLFNRSALVYRTDNADMLVSRKLDEVRFSMA